MNCDTCIALGNREKVTATIVEMASSATYQLVIEKLSTGRRESFEVTGTELQVDLSDDFFHHDNTYKVEVYNAIGGERQTFQNPADDTETGTCGEFCVVETCEQ